MASDRQVCPRRHQQFPVASDRQVDLKIFQRRPPVLYRVFFIRLLDVHVVERRAVKWTSIVTLLKIEDTFLSDSQLPSESKSPKCGQTSYLFTSTSPQSLSSETNHELHRYQKCPVHWTLCITTRLIHPTPSLPSPLPPALP